MSAPRVLDFTDARQRFSVEVLAGAAFELIAQLFVLSSTGEDEKAEFGVGAEWFDATRRAAGDDLTDRLDRLGCCGQAWFAVIAEAYEMGEPHTTDRFVDRLLEADPVELRRRMLVMLHKGGEGREASVDRAAAGDLEAFDALNGDDDGLRDLFAMDPQAMKDLLIDTIRDFDRRVFRGGAGVAGLLARDAEEKRAMARTMSPERFVETATNGVTFSVQPDVTGVVLVPSAAIRPFVLIVPYGSLRMFFYGVTDEVLSADPGAPPAWLVGVYKALADERRLRILHALAEEPMSFSGLTERLGLAKSTVHHHIRTLRRAGLIRVVVGDEKEYQLRTDAVPEAGKLLESYLGSAIAERVREGATP